MPVDEELNITLLLADQADASPYGGLDVQNLGWTIASVDQPHRAVILTIEAPPTWAGRTIAWTIFTFNDAGEVVQATEDSPLCWAAAVTFPALESGDERFVLETSAHPFTLSPYMTPGQYVLVVDIEGKRNAGWNRRFRVTP